MKELFFLVAAGMPKEEILRKLKDAIEEYLLVPSEENLKEIRMMSQFFMINDATDGQMEKAMDMVKDFDKFQRREELFNPDKN